MFKRVNSKKTRNVLPRRRCLKGLTRIRQGIVTKGYMFKWVNSKKTRNVLPRGRCLKKLTRKRHGMCYQGLDV